MEALKPFVNHLEFLGYEPTYGEKSVHLKHPKYFNISVRMMAGGIFVRALFGVKDERHNDKAGLFMWVNDLNRDAKVARFVVDTDIDLSMEAWISPTYSKGDFGTFMELWHSDEGILIRHEKTGEFVK